MGSGASKPEKDEIAKGITGKERPVDAVDSVDGRTMLHSAVLAGDVEAVRFLVENGAGNVRDRDGKVPLWYALQHRDADVRGRLEAELGAHAAQILVEVEDAVQVYLTHGVATTTTTATRTTGVVVERGSGYATIAPLTDPHMDMAPRGYLLPPRQDCSSVEHHNREGDTRFRRGLRQGCGSGP